MNSTKKILIFISGRGSNCKALIDYQKNNPACGFEIIGVITDKPGAAGLYYVKQAQIPTYEFFRADYSTRAEFIAAIFSAAETKGADLFALAGFMIIVPPDFIAKHNGQIINIHPSLLPAYPGLNTHERVLADKQSWHGCTVHLVNEAVDDGARIAQSKIAVLPDDTADTLAARVLIQEHRLYGWCLEQIAKKQILISGPTVTIPQATKDAATALGFVTF